MKTWNLASLALALKKGFCTAGKKPHKKFQKKVNVWPAGHLMCSMCDPQFQLVTGLCCLAVWFHCSSFMFLVVLLCFAGFGNTNPDDL